MSANTTQMTNQQKLDFLIDALVNGGPSMSQGLSLESQVAQGSWWVTIARQDGAGAVQQIPALQELADCKTLLIQQAATLAGLTAALQALASTQGTDPEKIIATVAEGVRKGVEGLKGTVTLGGK